MNRRELFQSLLGGTALAFLLPYVPPVAAEVVSHSSVTFADLSPVMEAHIRASVAEMRKWTSEKGLLKEIK